MDNTANTNSPLPGSFRYTSDAPNFIKYGTLIMVALFGVAVLCFLALHATTLAMYMRIDKAVTVAQRTQDSCAYRAPPAGADPSAHFYQRTAFEKEMYRFQLYEAILGKRGVPVWKAATGAMIALVVIGGACMVATTILALRLRSLTGASYTMYWSTTLVMTGVSIMTLIFALNTFKRSEAKALKEWNLDVYAADKAAASSLLVSILNPNGKGASSQAREALANNIALRMLQDRSYESLDFAAAQLSQYVQTNDQNGASIFPYASFLIDGPDYPWLQMLGGGNASLNNLAHADDSQKAPTIGQTPASFRTLGVYLLLAIIIPTLYATLLVFARSFNTRFVILTTLVGLVVALIIMYVSYFTTAL